MKNIDKIIMDKIEFEREQKGMSITELCDRCKFTRATYYNMLNGKHELGSNKIIQLCRALEIKTSYLFKKVEKVVDN